jgi:hypothetical protein
MPRNLNEQQEMGNQDDTIRTGSEQGKQHQGGERDINVSNPQQGNKWNNYQSRELADNEEGRMGAEEASKAFEDE